MKKRITKKIESDERVREWEGREGRGVREHGGERIFEEDWRRWEGGRYGREESENIREEWMKGSSRRLEWEGSTVWERWKG
jgi:hypothetical protein